MSVEIRQLLYGLDIRHRGLSQEANHTLHALRCHIRFHQRNKSGFKIIGLLSLNRQIPVGVLQKAEQQRHKTEDGRWRHDYLIFQCKSHCTQSTTEFPSGHCAIAQCRFSSVAK